MKKRILIGCLISIVYTFFIVGEVICPSESEIIIEKFKNKFSPVMNDIKNGKFNAYDYLNLSKKEISDKITSLLNEYDKIIIESLQLECVPVGLLEGYIPRHSEVAFNTMDPVVWERFKNVNPFDMVLKYNGKSWISADDFAKTGVEAYIQDQDSVVPVKILKSNLDKIEETEFTVSDDMKTGGSNIDKDLYYGIHIQGGFLITSKIKEIEENKFLEPGTFFRPIKINKDAECKTCSSIIHLNSESAELKSFIEDTYKQNDELYFHVVEPTLLNIMAKAAYYDSVQYEYMINYIKNNNIKAIDHFECHNNIFAHDEQEYAEIFCKIMHWSYLRDRLLSESILLIKKKIIENEK